MNIHLRLFKLYKIKRWTFFLGQCIQYHDMDQAWNYGTLSLRFNGHFPGGPGLAGTRKYPFWILLELRVMEVVVTTGAIRRVKLQSNCHRQQILVCWRWQSASQFVSGEDLTGLWNYDPMAQNYQILHDKATWGNGKILSVWLGMRKPRMPEANTWHISSDNTDSRCV